jgi:hypothetical protein
MLDLNLIGCNNNVLQQKGMQQQDGMSLLLRQKDYELQANKLGTINLVKY